MFQKSLAFFSLFLFIQGCYHHPYDPRNAMKSEVPGEAHIINIDNKDSLKITHDLRWCFDLSKIKNSYTPADLYPAVKKCMKKEKYIKAAELYILASVYGYYDTLRITDVTAHQATQALIIQNFSDIESYHKERLKVALNGVYANNAEICQKLQRLGQPDYQPVYMAAHGMSAFNVPYETLIKKEFDAESNWSKALQKYAKCKL